MDNEKIKEAVKRNYSKTATINQNCGCGCKSRENVSKMIGYSEEEMRAAPEANMGLGCGNPTAIGKIKEGDIVLDLGSGAGFDAFLAARKLGNTGRVIGVDMTKKMVERARENAKKYGYKNVEFKLGDIEKLPIDDSSVDVIISNCVINLAPNKQTVFKEAFRVLKPSGRMYVSDIVLLAELTEEERSNTDLISCCVGGAILRDEYIKIIESAGFKVNNLSENKDISKKQYIGFPVMSLSVEAEKNKS